MHVLNYGLRKVAKHRFVIVEMLRQQDNRCRQAFLSERFIAKVSCLSSYTIAFRRKVSDFEVRYRFLIKIGILN